MLNAWLLNTTGRIDILIIAIMFVVVRIRIIVVILEVLAIGIRVGVNIVVVVIIVVITCSVIRMVIIRRTLRPGRVRSSACYRADLLFSIF